MKTTNLKVLFCLSAFLLALGCEKENLTVSEFDQPENEFLKSMAGDTSITDVPDIVIDDVLLQDQACVSQYRENLLQYTYDRMGRLSCISYIRKCIVSTAADADLCPRCVYMRDRFIYDNSGRLTGLHRYSVSEEPQLTSPDLIKSYKYNTLGQLVQILTRKPSASYKWDKLEFLYYDRSGNMIRRHIKETNLPTLILCYTYDKLNRLVTITGYSNESTVPRFICNLFYDNMNNIERKEFLCPVTPAADANDLTWVWTVYYRYDTFNNPFKDLKLPVSSLFEWMDLISPANVTAITFTNSTDNRSVLYKYRYNNAGYPVLRYRYSHLSAVE